MLRYAAFITGTPEESARAEIAGNLYALAVQSVLVVVLNPDPASSVYYISLGSAGYCPAPGSAGNDQRLACALRNCAVCGNVVRFFADESAGYCPAPGCGEMKNILTSLLPPTHTVRTVTLLAPRVASSASAAFCQNVAKALSVDPDHQALLVLEEQNDRKVEPGIGWYPEEPHTLLLRSVLGDGDYRTRVLVAHLVFDFIL